MTVRDVRLHWPEAERALARGAELVVTRDGAPVARIVPFETRVPRRQRFRGVEHLRWLKAFWTKRPRGPSTDDLLARDRNE